MGAKYPLPDDISIEARTLLKGILEVNPMKRFKFSDILHDPWINLPHLGNLEPQFFTNEERITMLKEYC
jgi:serine/threonine protein kinase